MSTAATTTTTSTSSTYFPPLDQCLVGDTRLISWRTAYRALCDQRTAVESSHLEQFLQDNAATSILGNALAPHPRPDSKSASDFDNKTAPINVSQTKDANYNLDELKADAKWLSKEVDIDELSALRIAIIEWQERAQDQLLITAHNGSGGLSNTADSASLVLARSTTEFSASTLSAARPALDFAKEDVRRRRLQDVYLSEKSHLLRIAADLVSRSAISKADIQGQQTGAFWLSITQSWIDEVAATVATSMFLGDHQKQHELFLSKCISQLETALGQTESNTTWPKAFKDDTHANAYIEALFSEIVQCLRLLLAALYSLDGIPSAPVVASWFQLMDKYGFLQDAPLALATTDVSLPQLLMSIISVEMLKLQLAVGEIMNAAGVESQSLRGSHYVNDEELLCNLNITMYRAAQARNSIAAPAILAWSVIISVIRDISLIHRDVRDTRELGSDDNVDGMGRRSSVRRASVEPQSEFEKLYSKLCSRELEEHRDEPPRFFLTQCVDGMRVFSVIATLSVAVSAAYSSDAEAGTSFICKEALLDLTREGLPFVQYDAEILDAVLSFVTPLADTQTSRCQAAVLADKLLTDSDQLRPAVLNEALARFPYELSPLLRLCTALANAESRHRRPEGMPEIAEILHRLQYFTTEVPSCFRGYQLENEEDNTNAMTLTESIPVLARRYSTIGREGRLQLTTGAGEDGSHPAAFDIPEGTLGTIVKEHRPLVITLNHDYSGFDYLTALLFTFTGASELVATAPRTAIDKFGAAEIVALFTALLSTAVAQQDEADAAQGLLEMLSKVLGDSNDIVSIIASIFEAELLSHLNQQVTDGSLELVVAGAEFLNAIIKVSPERAWSILAKSSLLGMDTGAMSLVSVVNGTEVQSGHYRFLSACVEMYSLLLDDVISGLVKRAARPDQKAARFAISQDSPDATPVRTMSAVINAYQKILLDALHSMTAWKWTAPAERCCITTSVLDSFSRLLRSTYGIDVVKDAPKRLTYVLKPAADSLLSVCAPRSGSIPLVQIVERILPEGLALATDGLPVSTRMLLVKQICSVLNFLTVLLRITHSNMDSPIHISTLESGTFSNQDSPRAFLLAAGLIKTMPALASLLASEHAFTHGTYSLLVELVKSLGTSDGDTPSMLAQLSTDAAQAFLQVTTQLDRPLCDVQIERCIWDFLATVMTSKQQWFAIYLLTGKLPKSRAHRRNDETLGGKPILAYALDQLSGISSLPPQRAVGMLKYLAVAQQTWVWATNELRSHPDFVKNTLTWLESLRAPTRNASPSACIISARECEMSAYLCEIYAINLHASLEIGDKTMLKVIIPRLAYLRDHGAAVNAYNRSLHQRLESNLKATFPSSELSDFKRTSVNPATYGTEYFYDREIASKMLRHSESWHGRRADQGFSEEFSRANVNISLLHAQTALLRSWKTLATTLCEFAEEDQALQVELAKVAEQCLLSNANPQVDEPGVADVLQLRVELSFVLVSKLVSLRLNADAMKKLLPAAWELVATSPVDYDVASAPEDVRYYRQLLQVLYLAVQPHSYLVKAKSEMQYLPPPVASSLVSIVGKIIGPGFRALCGNLHNNADLALPADFALLTALLQAILAVPGISSVQTLLADIVAGSSLVRGALSLFSWADRLVDEATQDPVYGEIAVLFLLALSTVRPIAEQMALEGVLTQLSSGNLSNYYRKSGGKGPFDEPQRMFVIWTEGFLPLCLNLLDSVGPAIAAEVAFFLNSFPEQLKRAETSLVNETPSPRNPRGGAVTLSLISEAHSLSMIALILKSDMAQGAAEGINPADIPILQYKEEDVKTLVEALSRSRRSLQDRIRPATPVEERWAQMPVKGASDSLLQEKVIKEMTSMLAWFGGSEGGSP